MLLGRATQEDVKWLIRLIRQDLWINIGCVLLSFCSSFCSSIGPKYVLGALHPNAFNAWKKSNNLKKIVQKVQIHGMDEDDDDVEDEADEPKKKIEESFF